MEHHLRYVRYDEKRNRCTLFRTVEQLFDDPETETGHKVAPYYFTKQDLGSSKAVLSAVASRSAEMRKIEEFV